MNVEPKALRFAAWILTWISTGIGAFLLLVTILAVVVETRRVSSGKNADATVVRSEASTGRRYYNRAVIQFSTDSGDIVEARYPSSLVFDRPSIGDHIAIVYDPSNPARVVAKEFSFRLHTYATLLGLAALLMAPAIILKRQHRAAAHGTDVRRS